MSIRSHCSPPARRMCRTCPLLDEPERAVEGDRSPVVREDARRQLVQPVRPRPLDRRGNERGADAAPAPGTVDEHPELGEAEWALEQVEDADGLAVRGRDQRPLEVPPRRTPLDVDGRLGPDRVALLRHGGVEERERKAVALVRRPDLDGGRGLPALGRDRAREADRDEGRGVAARGGRSRCRLEPTLKPVGHMFVGSKAPWHEILDDLPRHDEYPWS